MYGDIAAIPLHVLSLLCFLMFLVSPESGMAPWLRGFLFFALAHPALIRQI